MKKVHKALIAVSAVSAAIAIVILIFNKCIDEFNKIFDGFDDDLFGDV